MAKLSKKERGYATLGGIIIAAIAVVAMIITNINKPNEEPHMSIAEAQKKCTVMEAVDLRKYNNAGNDVWELASKHCFAAWDRSQNPDNTDEKFIEIIEADWESRKNEEIEGQTIEELYNEVEHTL